MGKLLTYRNFDVFLSAGIENGGGAQELRQEFSFQAKIKDCLYISREMVHEASGALFHFDTTWRLDLERASGNDNFNIVKQALLKYFQLDLNPKGSDLDEQIKMVRRIGEVYRLIDNGLSRNCDIIIEDMGLGKKGRVALEQVRRRGVSPIRALFGFTTEWKHKPWQMSVGDIELDVSYLRGAPPDQFARTIVHEASHKFAQTTDVLYKDASFAKMDAKTLAEANELGLIKQQEIALPGRSKPLLPMSGYEDMGKSDEFVTPERWLQNADSYAWAARRIWKHTTGFKKKIA